MNAIGCDLSRYDVSFNPAAATDAIDFAFQKATEGLSYVDLKYEEIWQGVQQIPVRGAYHYQKSGLSWIAQADHFLETAAKHDYHMYALDVEEYGNTYTDTYFADCKRVMDYWRKNAKQKALIYTNGSTYTQMYLAMARLYGQTYTAQWMSDVDLWIASPTNAGLPALPKGREKWTFHQYSWSGVPARWGTGGRAVDENVFNGTLEQLYQWLGMEIRTEQTVETRKVITDAKLWSLDFKQQIDTLKAGTQVTGSPRNDGYFSLASPRAGLTRTLWLSAPIVVTPPPPTPEPVDGYTAAFDGTITITDPTGAKQALEIHLDNLQFKPV